MLSNEENQILDIKHMLEKSVEKYGENPAFWVNNDQRKFSISYYEAYQDVQGLSTWLIANGMKDKKIAIVGENSYEWAISYLATICGTGIAVPLDKKLCITELKHFLTATGCSCVIFSDELNDTFWQIGNDGVTPLELLINMDTKRIEYNIFSLRELIDEGNQMVATGNCEYSNAQIVPHALCSIMFDTDISNISKKVELTYEDIATEIKLASETFNISENNVFFSKLPLHHRYECIHGILLPLYKGASILYCEIRNENFGITTTFRRD